jgi:hypothetical protein
MTEELLNKLQHIKDHILCKSGKYEECAQYKMITILGLDIKTLGIDEEVKDTWYYELYMFRDKAALNEHKANAPTRAKRILNGHLEAENEEYVSAERHDAQKINDFFIFDDFDADTSYTGNWIDLDMNSAHPFFLTELQPEMYPVIKQMYDKRKTRPDNKLILNCICGHLRNTHYSLYDAICNNTFLAMMNLAEEIRKAGGKPFAIRRDGVLAMVPDNFKIPDTIPMGTDLGQFKAKYDKGTITTMAHTDFNYMSDMSIVKSKMTGTQKSTLLDKVAIVASTLTKTGLIIKE